MRVTVEGYEEDDDQEEAAHLIIDTTSSSSKVKRYSNLRTPEDQIQWESATIILDHY